MMLYMVTIHVNGDVTLSEFAMIDKIYRIGIFDSFKLSKWRMHDAEL